MKCPRCQQENPSGSNFCLECATPLKAVSPGGRPAPSYSDVTNALSEALEQQTATAEILRVISRSATTYEPVFEAIVRSASTLCRAPDVIILMLEEGGLRAVASIGPVAAAVRQRPAARRRRPAADTRVCLGAGVHRSPNGSHRGCQRHA